MLCCSQSEHLNTHSRRQVHIQTMNFISEMSKRKTNSLNKLQKCKKTEHLRLARNLHKDKSCAQTQRKIHKWHNKPIKGGVKTEMEKVGETYSCDTVHSYSVVRCLTAFLLHHTSDRNQSSTLKTLNLQTKVYWRKSLITSKIVRFCTRSWVRAPPLTFSVRRQSAHYLTDVNNKSSLLLDLSIHIS